MQGWSSKASDRANCTGLGLAQSSSGELLSATSSAACSAGLPCKYDPVYKESCKATRWGRAGADPVQNPIPTRAAVASLQAPSSTVGKPQPPKPNASLTGRETLSRRARGDQHHRRQHPIRLDCTAISSAGLPVVEQHCCQHHTLLLRLGVPLSSPLEACLADAWLLSTAARLLPLACVACVSRCTF